MVEELYSVLFQQNRFVVQDRDAMIAFLCRREKVLESEPSVKSRKTILALFKKALDFVRVLFNNIENNACRIHGKSLI